MNIPTERDSNRTAEWFRDSIEDHVVFDSAALADSDQDAIGALITRPSLPNRLALELSKLKEEMLDSARVPPNQIEGRVHESIT